MNEYAYQRRAVTALESIAKSLEKIANPVLIKQRDGVFKVGDEYHGERKWVRNDDGFWYSDDEEMDFPHSYVNDAEVRYWLEADNGYIVSDFSRGRCVDER